METLGGEGEGVGGQGEGSTDVGTDGGSDDGGYFSIAVHVSQEDDGGRTCIPGKVTRPRHKRKLGLGILGVKVALASSQGRLHVVRRRWGRGGAGEAYRTGSQSSFGQQSESPQ